MGRLLLSVWSSEGMLARLRTRSRRGWVDGWMGRCGVWSEVEDSGHGYHPLTPQGAVGSCSEENDTRAGILFKESSPLRGPRRAAAPRSWVVGRIEAGGAVTIARREGPCGGIHLCSLIWMTGRGWGRGSCFPRTHLIELAELYEGARVCVKSALSANQNGLTDSHRPSP